MKFNIFILLFLVPALFASPYRLISKKEVDLGWEFQLEYSGSDDYYVLQKNTISKDLTMLIIFENENEFSVKITDPDNFRFEPPYKKPFPFTKSIHKVDNRHYSFEIKEFPFSVKIFREPTHEVILNTENFDFYFTKYYQQIGFTLPSDKLYGLGERRQRFLFKPGTYSIWPTDRAAVENGTPGNQLYGQHPVYLMRENSANFHVVYLRSWSAMDVTFSQSSLVFKIAGRGNLELKFFLGDKKPETAIKMYHSYINGFATMPFWSMGYHQCAWGYKNSQMLLDVVNKFEHYGLPIDTIWSDIDYMDSYIDFSIDRTRYSPNDFKTIFDKGLHWVPILDIGIKISDNKAYSLGLEMDTFIKSNKTKTPLINTVWPGETHFPDFNHQNATKYWTSLIGDFHKDTNFSGIWLDMNEISGFVDGEIVTQTHNNFGKGKRFLSKFQNELKVAPDFSKDDFYDLPFLPGNNRLQYKTLSMDGVMANNGSLISQSEPLYQFDFHSLNGFSESLNTFVGITQVVGNPQPFILARSTAAGSGQFTTHWTGDNNADFENLRDSISEIFNFNLFGIPLTGADICGFNSNTWEELCARWMQIGSFYPFARNHRNIASISHEPYAFGDQSPVLKTSLLNLKLRYSMLKQYYSYLVEKNGIGTIFRPLFFEFPEDENLFDLDDQFMIDSALLVSPVVEEHQTTKKVYIPKGSSFASLIDGTILKEGENIVQAPLDGYIPIYQKIGTAVFMQNVTSVTKSSQLGSNFKLRTYFDSSNLFYSASGYIMGIDSYDEHSVTQLCLGETNCIIDVDLHGVVKDKNLLVEISVSTRNPNLNIGNLTLDSIEFIGISNKIVEYKANSLKISKGKFTISVQLP